MTAARAGLSVLFLMCSATALRGYLPDRGRAGEGAVSDPVATVMVVALLCVTVAAMAVSLVVRLRDRRAVAGDLTELARRPIGRGEPPSWRMVLIGLALAAGVVVAMSLLVVAFEKNPVFSFSVPPGSSTQTPKRPIEPPPVDAPPPEIPPPQQEPEVLGYLVASAAAMGLMSTVAAVSGVWRRRRPGPPPPAAEERRSAAGERGPESLIRAAQLGLAEMADPVRGPREAIIACYATMEHELSHVPDAAPQDFDTPTEVLARATAHHALGAENAAQLVALFTEARFSPHVMTERHRDAAARVLRLVLAELPQTDTDAIRSIP